MIQVAQVDEFGRVECVCGAVTFHKCRPPEPHTLAALLEQQKVECVEQIQELADFLQKNFRESVRLLGKKRTVETACSLLDDYKHYLRQRVVLPVQDVGTYY